MNILVLNCGSSSLKAAIVDDETGERRGRVRVERIGEAEPALFDADGPAVPCAAKDHGEALAAALPVLERARGGAPIDAVGHRVVHGGERFHDPARVDEAVLEAIEACVPLAPLHNPANLAGIVAAALRAPDVPHVAVFDTAFHAHAPPARAELRDRPELAAKHGAPALRLPRHVARLRGPRGGAAFLGRSSSGCGSSRCTSATARASARSSSAARSRPAWAMTPLEGLVMGTRSGDLDPGALLALARAEGLDHVDALLNHESGSPGSRASATTCATSRSAPRRATTAAGWRSTSSPPGAEVHRRLRRRHGRVDASCFTGGIGENARRHAPPDPPAAELPRPAPRRGPQRRREGLAPPGAVAEVSAEGSRCAPSWSRRTRSS
jgi:acetate kinase